ncbi:tetratricopeptide repeat protein [Thermopirellula anaerolimosa]
MRTVNRRFVVIFTVSLILLGIAVYFLQRFQVRRNARFFYDRALQAQAEGKVPDAIRNLQWYVEFVPTDTEAAARLGSLLVDAKAYGAAFFRLESVLRRDPSRSDSRRLLVDILLRMGRFRDAQEHLEQYLLKEFPEDADLLAKWARCLRGLRQPERALSVLQQAIEKDAALEDAYLLAAAITRYDLKRPEEGDAWIDRLLKAVPESPTAKYAAAVYFYELKDYAKAYELVSQSAEQSPQDVQTLLLAADTALRLDKADECKQWAERILQIEPDNADAHALLANASLRLDGIDAAIKILEESITKVKPRDRDRLLWTLASLELDVGRADSAEARVEALTKSAYDPPRVRYLRGRLLAQKGQWYEAVQTLEQARTSLVEQPDLLKQVDFWLGVCYGQLGNFDQSFASYAKAVNQDPLWPQARLGRAAAFTELGRVDEAVAEYRTLVQMNQLSTSGLLDFARLLVLQNLARSRSERDWTEVRQVLDAVDKQVPNSPDTAILRAEIAAADGDNAEAEKTLEDARKNAPDSLDLVLTLTALAYRGGDASKAEQLLQEAEQKFGTTAGVLSAKARFLVGTDAAPEQLDAGLSEIAAQGESLPAAERQRLLNSLTVYAIQADRIELAKRFCRELSSLAPNSLRVRLLLFDLAIRAQDYQTVEPVLDEIAKIEGRGPLWNYGRAVYLFLKSKGEDRAALRSALGHLDQAAAQRPNWARLQSLRGIIYEQLGDEPAALNAYLGAVELGDRDLTTIRRVIPLLYKQQRFLEADRIVRSMEERQVPLSADVDRLASTINLQLENYDRALDMARRAAENSSDYRDHAWYGTVLSVLANRAQTSGQSADVDRTLKLAEAEFRKAVELSPKTPEAWVALMQFYARSGQKEKAEAVIEETRAALEGGLAPLALGQCYETLQNLDEAERYYQEALTTSPSDPQVIRQVAEFYLRTGRTESAVTQISRLTGGEVPAKQEDVAWGRRAMALLLANRGGYENLQKGLSLMQQNRTGGVGTIQDARAEALLLSSHPLRRERNKAREILERLIAESPQVTPDDRFVLAQLYMADGDVVNAARHMRSLLASHGNEPRYVQRFVSFLIQQEDYSEAEVWQRRLETLAPDAFSTVSLRARLLVEQGQDDAALNLLKTYAEQAPADNVDAADAASEKGSETGGDASGAQTADDAKTAETPSADGSERLLQLRRAVVGDALEGLAQVLRRKGRQESADRFLAEVESVYRDFVEKYPQATLLLSAFLARRGRADEALELFRRHWAESDPNIMTAAATVLLSRVYEDKSRAADLEAVILEALEKLERPQGLLLTLADFYGLQGRVDEAAALYEEVLRRDPRNLLALNNLAVISALGRKNLDRALQCIDQALAIAGPVANVLDSKAIILMARENPQEALRIVNEAISDQPTGLLYFRQAQALLALKQTSAAKKAFEEAFAMGFSRDALHPLERNSYDRLEAALGKPEPKS